MWDYSRWLAIVLLCFRSGEHVYLTQVSTVVSCESQVRFRGPGPSRTSVTVADWVRGTSAWPIV